MPTLYDNFERVRQYIDQHQGGGGDMSAYVTKDELSAQSYLTAVPAEYITDAELSACGYITMGDVSACGYITSIPSTYASYNGVYSYLHSIGIDKKSNWGCYIDSAVITDSELSGDIAINGINTSQLATYAAISNMGYVTSSDLPVIDENIIPKETGTYTLGDSSYQYAATYTYILKLDANGWNDIHYVNDYLIGIKVGNTERFRIGGDYIAPLANNTRSLGLNNQKWFATYTTNLYTNTAYLQDTSYTKSIVPAENNAYTLGDDSHRYIDTYSYNYRFGYITYLASDNDYDIHLSVNGRNKVQWNLYQYIFVDDNYRAQSSLGANGRPWGNIYTTNIYTENVSYTSGKSSIKMNDRNVDIWANNKKMVNVSDYNGVVPTQTNVNLGGSSNKWAATYTSNLYADTIHNFIWTGTSAEYAALSDYTTYQIYLIQEA